jgi:hypothetical protein
LTEEKSEKATPKTTTSPSKSQGKKLEIRVCFDTNSIHNESPLYLLPVAVKDLIDRHSKHYDVSILWYIPEIVRGEREFRMRSVAEKLLPRVKDLETLFGVGLNITKENINERIAGRIAKEISANGMTVLPCDPNRVGWARVFTDAVFRRPPFEAPSGEKEKGFRDLVVGESFLQLVEDSPRAKKSCQIVLVTNDGLLREMIQTRLVGFENTRVVADLNSLEELINTLASDATEEYVNSVREDAATFFFINEDTPNSLYFAGGADKEVDELLTALLKRVPEGAEWVRYAGVLRLFGPNFVSKSKQRITWVSRITVELQAVKQERYLDIGLSNTLLARAVSKQGATNLGLGSPVTVPSSAEVSPAQIGGLFSIGLPQTPVTVSTSKSETPNLWKTRERIVFQTKAEIDIQWAVTVTTQRRFTHGSIISVKMPEPEWQQVQLDT